VRDGSSIAAAGSVLIRHRGCLAFILSSCFLAFHYFFFFFFPHGNFRFERTSDEPLNPAVSPIGPWHGIIRAVGLSFLSGRAFRAPPCRGASRPRPRSDLNSPSMKSSADRDLPQVADPFNRFLAREKDVRELAGVA